MKLVSSNQTKLNEFKRIIPSITATEGKDLKEVQGTPEEVIIYKAIEAGKDCVVEDTILIIDGEEVIDIKWKIQELQKINSRKCTPVSWQVLLGFNTGKTIEIYRGIVNGIIIPDSLDQGYGFDPYFLPDGSDVTLAVLESVGGKDRFSARRNALINLKSRRFIKTISIKDVPIWTGNYQND